MSGVYLHDWFCFEDLCRSFSSNYSGDWRPEGFNADNVLFASYLYENYAGDAFVLLYKDGQFFEVNGGHCSCYGLEGQFDADPCDIKTLVHRLTKGNLGNGYQHKFRAELLAVLNDKFLKEVDLKKWM